MGAECCSAGRGTPTQGIAARLAFLPAALLAIAIPKCPLCLAGPLAFLGVSAGVMPGFAALVWPLRTALALLALGLLVRARMASRMGS